MAVYEPALLAAVVKYPTEYSLMPEQVPGVAVKMRAAFEKGSYNKDGRAVKATCKSLGIPHTYAAINEYLNAA